MRKIIYHMRSQPEGIRRHILHALTLVFGVILVFLWIYSLGTNLNSPDTQVKVNNNLQPFSALKANLIGGYKSISQPQAEPQ